MKRKLSITLAISLMLSSVSVFADQNTTTENEVTFEEMTVNQAKKEKKESEKLEIQNLETLKEDEKGTTSTYATPQIIDLNKEYWMTIDRYTSNDFYVKFTVPNDGYIHLKFKHVVDSSGKIADWGVDILDSNNKEIVYGATAYEPQSKDGYYHYAVGVKKGTYTAKIDSRFTVSSGSWQIPFRVNFTATNNFEKENNDTRLSATPISTNKIYTGIAGEGFLSDEDWYKFSINTKSDVNFKINYPSYAEFSYFNLYNSSGTEVAYVSPDDMAIERGVLSHTFKNLSSGTYYLEIYSYDEKIPYQISVTPTPVVTSKPAVNLTKDIYRYDAGKGKYLTYINGKGYSQYSYLNRTGDYAFTPSSWMKAAGLNVSMPTKANNYKMTVENPYMYRYEYANKVLAEAKKGNLTPYQIEEALKDIEVYGEENISTKAAPSKKLTTDINRYNAGSGKHLTFINGKGYSQYAYLNRAGDYAFTPSSWMKAAGLTVTMPTSKNGYTMKVDNPYINKYNNVVKEIKTYI